MTETASPGLRKMAVRHWGSAASGAASEATAGLMSLRGCLNDYDGEPVSTTEAWQRASANADEIIRLLSLLPADIGEIVAFRMAEEEARK